jgi:hypothetical protein
MFLNVWMIESGSLRQSVTQNWLLWSYSHLISSVHVIYSLPEITAVMWDELWTWGPYGLITGPQPNNLYVESHEEWQSLQHWRRLASCAKCSGQYSVCMRMYRAHCYSTSQKVIEIVKYLLSCDNHFSSLALLLWTWEGGMAIAL